MIYEFALDPEVVASWCEPHAFARFRGAFGVGTPRIASLLPRKAWADRVLSAVEKRCAGDALARQRAITRLGALLGTLTSASLHRGSPADEIAQWLPLVLREHERLPFHAILSSTDAPEPVIDPAELDERDHRWSPDPIPPLRRVDTVVALLAPFLRLSSEIRFVDPYFEPRTRRWQVCLAAMVRAALASSPRERDVKFEYHTCASGRRERGAPLDEKAACARIVGDAESFLPRALPLRVKLRVIVWRERTDGAAFHDRYILTERGGVEVPHGLDFDGGSNATASVHLLSRAKYDLYSPRFLETAAAFERLATVDVTGTAVAPPASAGHARR